MKGCTVNQPNKITEEQLYTLIEINKSIAALNQNDSFQHFKKAVEQKIENEIPSPALYGFNNEAALEYSMRLAYIKGMKEALAIVENSPKRLADYKAALDKLKK